MAKARQVQIQVLHYPTLKTVMAIEKAVKNSDKAISRNKIIGRLEGKVMRSTLNCALDYLEKRGIILETKNGFIWTFNPNENCQGLKQMAWKCKNGAEEGNHKVAWPGKGGIP